jgi:hypothetical protein
MILFVSLGIPVVLLSQVPLDFRQVTFPIRLEDSDMIASIWMTLRLAPDAVATHADHAITFWRRPVKSALVSEPQSHA